MSHRDISWDHFTIIFFGTPGEDLRVRGQVAVQEHGLQHLGGEGPWQTMADHGRWKPNRGGCLASKAWNSDGEEKPRKMDDLTIRRGRFTVRKMTEEWLLSSNKKGEQRTNKDGEGTVFWSLKSLSPITIMENWCRGGQTSSPYKNLGWFQIQNMSSLLWTQWFPNDFYPLGHGLYPNLLNYPLVN